MSVQHKPGRMSGPITRRRSKLAPDPDTRRAILTAASTSLRDNGVQGLSIAAVLERAQLSTRAFYRHFESRDQLVSAVFLEMAIVEKRRLKRKMASADTPVEGVAAWIDGRLDLAFNENIKSDLRRTSLVAQAQIFAAPELIQPAYAKMLEPLIDQIQRGMNDGAFYGVDPTSEAQSIQGVVWASTERQWTTGTTGHSARAVVRNRTVQFCLRGLGVAAETITQVAGNYPWQPDQEETRWT